MMMRKTAVYILLVVLLVILLPSSLSSRPEPEDEDTSAKRSLFLLVEAEAADNEIYISRFLLPSSLSLFAWADFAVRDGEVSMEGEESFRIREGELEAVESHGQYQVVKYSFLLSDLGASGQERFPPDNRYEVRFSSGDLMGGGGDVLIQPVRWAALEAIKKSGKPQGRLKVLSLTHTGDGRFRAEVVVL